MPYKAYIDAKMKLLDGKVKWVMIEAMPNVGTYLTKTEAEAQARQSLKYWRRQHKAGKLRAKYGAFRSRVVRK